MEESYRRQLMRLKLCLPDDYIFKQCDEDEDIIAEHCWTGKRIRWNGQFWQIAPEAPSVKLRTSNLGRYSASSVLT
jgi:hypothetical protein